MTRSNEQKAKKIFLSLVRPFIKKKKIKVTHGKKVWEIRPPGNWHKGKAVQTILRRIKTKCLPIYIGDDVTDEDAFAVLRGRGIGIRVGRGPSRASYYIKGVSQMEKLLAKLQTLLES